MQRGLVAEIDHAAVAHNLAITKELAANCKIIAVVKADAYGHGAVDVSRTLIQRGVSMLAVAYASEGKELRESGIKEVPILSLFDPDPQDVIMYNLTPVISNKGQAKRLSDYCHSIGCQRNIHLKIDTGMGRTGFQPEQTEELIEIFNLSNLRVVGIMSHFSDADILDKEFARSQIEGFDNLRGVLQKDRIKIDCWHMANSAALISVPEARFDAVRPGLMLYGLSPMSEPDSKEVQLRPVMAVKTHLLQIRSVKAGRYISYGRTFKTSRDSLIGVLPVGYADGINRLFSNNLEVLVCGTRAPIVGSVCMDTIMIDLTDIEGATEGEEVVIMGSQGRESINAKELAAKIGTIPYEILTTLGLRATKRHLFT